MQLNFIKYFYSLHLNFFFQIFQKILLYLNLLKLNKINIYFTNKKINKILIFNLDLRN